MKNKTFFTTPDMVRTIMTETASPDIPGCFELDIQESMNLASQDKMLDFISQYSETLPTIKRLDLFMNLAIDLIDKEELITSIERNYRPAFLKKLKRLISKMIDTAQGEMVETDNDTDDINTSFHQVMNSIKGLVENESYDQQSIGTLMRMHIKSEKDKDVLAEFTERVFTNKDSLR